MEGSENASVDLSYQQQPGSMEMVYTGDHPSIGSLQGMSNMFTSGGSGRSDSTSPPSAIPSNRTSYDNNQFLLTFNPKGGATQSN